MNFAGHGLKILAKSVREQTEKIIAEATFERPAQSRRERIRKPVQAGCDSLTLHLLMNGQCESGLTGGWFVGLAELTTVQLENPVNTGRFAALGPDFPVWLSKRACLWGFLQRRSRSGFAAFRKGCARSGVPAAPGLPVDNCRWRPRSDSGSRFPNARKTAGCANAAFNHLKNSSICQRRRYSSQIFSGSSSKLLVRKTSERCSTASR